MCIRDRCIAEQLFQTLRIAWLLGSFGEIHKELPTGALLIDYGGDEERIAYGQHFAHAHCNSYDRVPIEAAFGTCHAYSA